MARIVFLALLAIAFAGNDFLPVKAGAWAPAKTFIQGFMNGYAGKPYTLGQYCLDATTEAKLNADIVAMFSSLIRGHVDDVFEQLKVVEGDLDAVANDCGLYAVQQSLTYDLKNDGVIHLVMNALWHALDISDNFLDILGNLLAGNLLEAGTRLGETVAYVIEPQPGIFLPEPIVKLVKELVKRPIL